MDKLRQHIEQVTPLTDEEFEHIKTFFSLKKVRKNQYLIHDGDEVKYEYLVLSGIYKVFYVDGQGKEYIVQFAQEDNYARPDVPFDLQTALTKQGAIFHAAAPWSANSIADGNIVSGQNPASAKGVGEKMVAILESKA